MRDSRTAFASSLTGDQMHRSIMRVVLAVAVALITTAAWSANTANVAVIINDKSQVSRTIGAYYALKRKIPAKNIIHIKCAPEEMTTNEIYKADIEKPVKSYLARTGLSKTVDYLVLTKGVPLRLHSGWSVDSLLMVMDQNPPLDNPKIHGNNPYYGKTEHFSRKKYGIYLSTRLDGYTVQDAKALVDRSLAARRQKGTFLIDSTPKRNVAGYDLMNTGMSRAHDKIAKRGFSSSLDAGEGFVGNRDHLMGYFSWGSNDPAFDKKKYHSLRFLPGAIAETAVSTSARTLSKASDPGQSLIGDLIASGVTGVKGYVAEPTLAAICDPEVLFDRYLRGYNLAESFYMASRFIFWRDVVIGDPLCAPYATK